MCCLPHTMLHIQASMSHCLQSIACGCRNYVLPEDLEYFLPAHKAAKAFDLLDVDSDGRVTLHDIRDAVLNVYSVGPIAMPQQYRLSLHSTWHLQPECPLMLIANTQGAFELQCLVAVLQIASRILF